MNRRRFALRLFCSLAMIVLLPLCGCAEETESTRWADAADRIDQFLDAAFESAHALKGVAGNLSLTPLYEPLVSITELLRAREDTDYSNLLNEILMQRDKLEKLC